MLDGAGILYPTCAPKMTRRVNIPHMEHMGLVKLIEVGKFAVTLPARMIVAAGRTWHQRNPKAWPRHENI